MNTITRLALLLFLALPATAEEADNEALKKAFPWIFVGDDAFRYETISTDAIHAYCREQQLEMSLWHEEYQKRFGEVKDRVIPEEKKRPENGLLSGVPELIQLNVTYYINKRASEGWRVVGISHDFFVFERAVDPNKENKKKPNKAEMATPRKPSD